MTANSRAARVLTIAVLMLGCAEEHLPGLSTASTADGTDGSSEDTNSTESETGDEPPSNLIEIPGATFAMGCGADDVDCDSDNPEHQVTVSTFMIERTEVSVTEYRACVTDGMCTTPAMDADCNYGVDGRDSHPVNCVTWQQAADFCSYRDRRLPTEAEWELAAAGPDARTFPWGSADATCQFAHMFGANGMMGGYGCLTNITSPVDGYPDGASVNGVLQLAGNVEEWVADWYAEDYYTTGETTDPQGPADGTAKVKRGGDWFDASPLSLRTFERGQTSPDQAQPERGFRCAM